MFAVAERVLRSGEFCGAFKPFPSSVLVRLPISVGVIEQQAMEAVAMRGTCSERMLEGIDRLLGLIPNIRWSSYDGDKFL